MASRASPASDISRSGSTVSAGIFKGLGHEGSARLAFLLVGSVAAFLTACPVTRLLVECVENRTLIPFAIHCSVARPGSRARFALA
ncbi:hypothetical protein AB5J72_44370 [Streptomyces sp. CG1]|uniref:hypothetical protein n=1 Tax=Streptomyces sp. CG1 TaxID=1287523 RepID=UPI0034E29A69